MNVLGVCSQDMQFIYILPGWEGSAADGRVLRDALSRRRGLKVPKGNSSSYFKLVFMYMSNLFSNKIFTYVRFLFLV